METVPRALRRFRQPAFDSPRKPDLQRPILSQSGAWTLMLTAAPTRIALAGRRRCRRSRWDPPSSDRNGQSTEGNDSGSGTRKGKSRSADDDELKPAVQLPDFMKDLTGGIEFDPEIQALNASLLEMSGMLQSGRPLDDKTEGARFPSPEPIYDSMGIRINTREYEARERLNKERQEIISQIIKRNPAFKPPLDYRPPQYPGYNFIELIIGPRRNTQKRMQRETGAKIVIRGKGSVKEGRLQQKRDLKSDPSENEDLHVMVEAETQEALDAAAGMVEKLLQPVDEVLNEHKRQQLRELATLNGTIKDEEYCRLCDVLCKIGGDGGHPTIDCHMKGTSGKKMDDEYRNFLAELGGTVPESATKQSSTLALGPGSTVSNPPWLKNTSGLGSNVLKPPKDDDTNLYIRYLPPTLDDNALIHLFSQFVCRCPRLQMANAAIQAMNSHLLEGRTIAVKVAGRPLQPSVPPAPPASTVPIPATSQPTGACPSQQFTAGCPLTASPPASCTATPVPWGAPVTTPPFGQSMPPYGVSYAPPPLSSAAQQYYPPGVQSESISSTPSAPTSVYGSTIPAMPAAVQPVQASSLGCAPYYSVVPLTAPAPTSTTDHSQSMGNVSWAVNPPMLLLSNMLLTLCIEIGLLQHIDIHPLFLKRHWCSFCCR
ncbi:hypothetical protein ACJRO7_002898 [Eucalyptus globulus]|uniref:Branchpoint-bridging protein n=1 Tax=Eucalyptus globulus TaxID=34317 RepID=A0ABD3LZK5_EUCGL